MKSGRADCGEQYSSGVGTRKVGPILVQAFLAGSQAYRSGGQSRDTENSTAGIISLS